MFTIKIISAIETYSVRHPVLRALKPIESCEFPNDDDPSTVHFGLFAVSKLAAVASLFHQKSSLFEGNQYQLRGMAVLENFRRRGYGEALVNISEEYARKNDSDIIWFNARENAVPFYQSLDYKIFGEAFEIENIGTHYVMYKQL